MNAATKGNEYYVFQDGGRHLGPASVDVLARNMIAGTLSSDTLVGEAGGSTWEPVGKVPSIRAAVQQITAAPPSNRPAELARGSDAPAESGRWHPSPHGPAMTVVMSPAVERAASARLPPTPPHAPITVPRAPLPPSVAPAGEGPGAAAPAPVAVGAPLAAASPRSATTTGAPTATPPNAAATAAAAIETTIASTPAAAAPQPSTAASPVVATAATAKPAAAALTAPQASAAKLDPKYRLLPLVIFGACGAVAVVLTGVTLLVR